MSSVIHGFLNDRKQEWLKKKLITAMSEEEKLLLIQEAQIKYLLATWLPDAANRESQLSWQPTLENLAIFSAKTSSIIANAEHTNDGYLRTGNINFRFGCVW